MIEVTIQQTGDRAEAETPEAAVVAARTLGREAWDAYPVQGYDPTVISRVDGRIVATSTLRGVSTSAMIQHPSLLAPAPWSAS